MIWLYRHFDAEGMLLYVGITSDPERRDRQHTRDSEWSRRVVTTTMERYSTRVAAFVAERSAIIAEYPIYNRMHHRRARELQVMLVRAELQRLKKAASIT